MKMLNIACGSRYHRDWINIDIHPVSKDVIRVNVLKGLPFEDSYFDVVYTSHFLEHLNLQQARFLLKEVYRVLKKGGIVRIVVPDLENICREYIMILEKVLEDEQNFREKYQWIVIELLDQLVRTSPGGEMKKFFDYVVKNKNKELADYIQYRIGEKLLGSGKEYQVEGDMEGVKRSNLNVVRQKLQIAKQKFKNLNKDKIKNKLLYLYLNLISFLIPKSIRDGVLVRTSIFERHQFMYDRYSLKVLLEEVGFSNIQFLSYNQSNIPNFNTFFLDINPDGTPYKGFSSLYCEATK